MSRLVLAATVSMSVVACQPAAMGITDHDIGAMGWDDDGIHHPVPVDYGQACLTCEDHVALCRASNAPPSVGETQALCAECYSMCEELRSLRLNMFGVECEPWPSFASMLDGVTIDDKTQLPTGTSRMDRVSCAYWTWP